MRFKLYVFFGNIEVFPKKRKLVFIVNISLEPMNQSIPFKKDAEQRKGVINFEA